MPPFANKKSDYPPGEQQQMIADSAASNKSVHIKRTKRCRVSKPDYPPGEQQQMIADSTAEKKAVQNERTKRCRVKKRFAGQIDSDFEPVERKIVVGGFEHLKPMDKINDRDLRTTEVTQRSEMKQIKGYGSSGIGGDHFRGAIVSHHDGSFDGVQEGLFVVKESCYAKHGLHKGAKFSLAVRHTGFVNGFAFISWDDKPRQFYWAPESCIQDASAVEFTKRRTAVPDRFQPGTSDVARKPVATTTTVTKPMEECYEYFRSETFRKLDRSYAVKSMPLKGRQHWTQQQH